MQIIGLLLVPGPSTAFQKVHVLSLTHRDFGPLSPCWVSPPGAAVLTPHSASHPVLPEKIQLVRLELQESRAQGPLLTFVQEGPTGKGHTLFGTQSPPLCWMYRRECGHSPGA